MYTSLYKSIKVINHHHHEIRTQMTFKLVLIKLSCPWIKRYFFHIWRDTPIYHFIAINFLVCLGNYHRLSGILILSRSIPLIISNLNFKSATAWALKDMHKQYLMLLTEKLMQLQNISSMCLLH